MQQQKKTIASEDYFHISALFLRPLKAGSLVLDTPMSTGTHPHTISIIPTAVFIYVTLGSSLIIQIISYYCTGIIFSRVVFSLMHIMIQSCKPSF